MKSFNVMGDCVSRDILEFEEVKVLQYNAFSSMISVCSGKSSNVMKLEDLDQASSILTSICSRNSSKATKLVDFDQNIGNEYPNFVKRCIMFDFNKSVLDYVLEKKSDYFVLDILDSRHPLLINGCHCITLTNRMRKIVSLLPRQFGLNEYKEVSPYTDISMEQWEDCIGRVADRIRNHYTVKQIVLNIHYGVRQYICDSGIKSFSSSTVDEVNRYNVLVKKLFEMLKKELDGCHIIEFPDQTVAVKEHKWGLAPLHYHDIYYRYGTEAIKVILRDFSYEEEKIQLERLRVDCSERFELLKTKKELEIAQRKLKWFRNALNFAEAHASDSYGEEKFSKWLNDCKSKNYRVVVLKCGCAAGRILLKGLGKYGIDIVLSTEDEDFDKMSDEQFTLCREADIVISANVHSNTLPERDGIRAISVYDILV